METISEESLVKEIGLQEFLKRRPRRNRQSSAIRSLLQENYLRPNQFVSPLFVHEGTTKQPISSMPGIFRHSLDSLVQEVKVNIR